MVTPEKFEKVSTSKTPATSISEETSIKEPEQPITAPQPSGHIKPQAFTPTIGNFKIKECYQAAIKNLSGKEVFWLHKKIRDDQIKCLEAIKDQLSKDTTSTPENRKKILIDVLRLTSEHIEREFRFFSRKSRLVEILNEEIGALQTNLKTDTGPKIPEQAYTSAKNPEQFAAFLKEPSGTHSKISPETATLIKKNMDTLLKPHGFLQAVMDFIKHVKNTDPKDSNNHRPRT